MTFGIIIKKPLKPTRNSAYNRQDMKALCNDKNSPIARMLNDRTMIRHIKNGNASDKGLKREAEAIQRESFAKNEAKRKQERFQRVIDAREKYKRRYKEDLI